MPVTQSLPSFRAEKWRQISAPTLLYTRTSNDFRRASFLRVHGFSSISIRQAIPTRIWLSIGGGGLSVDAYSTSSRASFRPVRPRSTLTPSCFEINYNSFSSRQEQTSHSTLGASVHSSVTATQSNGRVVSLRTTASSSVTAAR